MELLGERIWTKLSKHISVMSISTKIQDTVLLIKVNGFREEVGTTTLVITRILVAAALEKTHFPTVPSGVHRGRRKGDPNTSVVGKIM